MSLWRHESSSCRKPRLSTEHCCRLHTLAIFCRPPGPASTAAPRTPSRVARGRARTRGLGVAPPAGGGAGAGPASPHGGPGGDLGAHLASTLCGGAGPRAAVPSVFGGGRHLPWPPRKAPSHGWSSVPATLHRRRTVPKATAVLSFPFPGFLFLKSAPFITSSLPIAGHQLLQVP